MKNFLLTLFLLVLFSPLAMGAGIPVNTLTDEVTDNDRCSLREAIINANNNAATYPDCVAGESSTTDNIVLPSGTYSLTHSRSTPDDASIFGDLDITDNLTITGSGASSTIIDASGLTNRERVLHILNMASVTLDGITIKGGSAWQGGGIYSTSSGTLIVQNSTVSGNTATSSSSDTAFGGGIFSNANSIVILENSTVSGNTATSSSSSAYGGGIYSETGGVLLENSTVSGNTATSSSSSAIGGGIYSGTSPSILENSTVSGNTATSSSSSAYGGGIYSETVVVLENSTVSGNTATSSSSGAIGGGICAYYGTLTLENSTVSGNTATSSSSDVYGGGVFFGGAPFSLKSSLLADNSTSIGSGADCYTSDGITLNSYGYNLIENSSDCTLDYSSSGADSSTDLTGDPLLSALADNGGPTQTQALQVTSKAIDAGNCVNIAGTETITTDQRGFSRDAHCDIGAYEYQVICGDSMIQSPETCDDGNTASGDGCSATCATDATETLYYQDFDADGYGNAGVSQYGTSPPVGYMTDSTDCNDTNSSIYPAATEVYGDGIDQDCNGLDLFCGDGIVQSSEQCDGGSGCSATCMIDTDTDGVTDDTDTDDDNDGTADAQDAFSLDASEMTDTDGDGIGNNADTDDDNDGVPDSSDAFPLDATQSVASGSAGTGGGTTTGDGSGSTSGGSTTSGGSASGGSADASASGTNADGTAASGGTASDGSATGTGTTGTGTTDTGSTGTGTTGTTGSTGTGSKSSGGCSLQPAVDGEETDPSTKTHY